ncbi:MAG: hypothetical protein A3E87_01610 [Gammaproteobacteria bacterium RIFCSPHIGHO2_12_FULL_35_23]|nr:MAG: hypothetical protein A3E87_01610 [Gammaproteobacteria bacterium RIFCSPHIGHO2_12_FULL_35_23]
MTTSIQLDTPGQVGVRPRLISIQTTDSFATITTTGWLNQFKQEGFSFYADDLAKCSYGASNDSDIFKVSISGSDISLVANSGNVVLPVVSGNFAVFTGTEGSLDDLGYSPTNAAKTKVVMASAAVIANHIAVFSDTAGTVNDDAATAINGGSLQAGLSGTAGSVISFPATALKGSLAVTAVANTGDTVTTISNAAMGQTSTISIPDPGAATSNFVLTSSAASTQSISTGINITGGANNLQVVAGNVLAGSSGAAGSVYSYPATAARGSLVLTAVNNTGDTVTTISNVAMGQASIISIPDPAAATANFVVAPSALVSGNMISASGTAGLAIDSDVVANRVLYTSFATPDANVNLVRFDITVTAAALAAGASVTLLASSGSKQYVITGLWINSGGTNFSGGGGDRLLSITDNTTEYSVIPAASLGTLTNNGWGIAAALPFPASAPINTATAAGVALVAKYSGGAADYSAGSIVISGLLQRVA